MTHAPLRLARGGALSNLPLLVAMARGLLPGPDVRQALLPAITAPDALRVFRDGEADAGTVAFTLPMVEEDVVVLAGSGLGGLAVLVSPAIGTWEDLAGRRVGTLRGGPLEVLLAEYLVRAGLDLAAVDLRHFETLPGLLEALDRGELEAGTMVEPFSTRLAASGRWRRLGDGTDLWGPRYPDTVFVARRRLCAEARPLLVAVIRAMRRAQAWIESAPAEAVAAVAPGTYGPAAGEALAALHRMPPEVDIRDLGPFFPARARTLRRLGYIDREPPEMLDFSLLEEAMATETDRPDRHHLASAPGPR
jgi:ABC-type nitrate/sulfonate/bicarbonate transport system substrate-binding protein